MFFCTILWTNPKAGHSIVQWVVGRAERLGVGETTPMPGRKKKKKSARECRGLHPYTIALAKESQRERERVCVWNLPAEFGGWFGSAAICGT